MARAVVLLACCGVVYVAFVLLGVGRRVDAGAFTTLSPLSGVLVAAANVVRQVLPFVLALFALVLGAVALARRRWHETIRSAVLVVAALAVAEGLKTVLPRPGLVDSSGIVGNSYPSRHVAVALALALVVVILSPSDRWHVWLALVTGAAVVGVAWCSVISFAHRPSDVIGAALLVGFLVQVVFWRSPAMVDSRSRFAAVLLCCAGAGVVLVAVSAVLVAADARLAAAAAGIPGWLLLCGAPAAYAVMLAPTGPTFRLRERWSDDER